ncbi:5-formaminoimidazole-4-carboxamide-1-(beta)-D-ribofuranosyl 5'-monophosphate synthetase [Ignicoccus pacificus DSM 13166]|uniref:5-formaminoimidazole-4-carboxamide-1-(Beta)-D-ribofuranosyl 5'-monophosphate synthetase n=1 Tax=Ignicoccus pacificus DSM 13166 TaxID=940294 RepID=A0A977KB36_9CREN|nr:5-formaminoimidazole-4-carboxamide-1-(beta)-D-ribofuranosyl 5'-monophosphate synthetase [Ignicoccus pacificus DSM 13166]
MGIVDEMRELVRGYSSKPAIAAVASHSALDLFDGAKDEGFRTIAICQKGREIPYKRFSRVVDKCILLDKYKDVLKEEIQEELRKEEAIFVPNRSFAVYVGYDAIERDFKVPMFGNRFMLRWEERVGEKNYYKLLDEAGIRRPKTFKDPEEIDRPVIVKVPEAKRRVERGFFIAMDKEDYYKRVEEMLKLGIIDEEGLKEASIEELVLGAHFNINYFNSVMKGEVELHSVDRRIQSDLDGWLRLPAREQLHLRGEPRMIEVGHIPTTLRESLLTKAFIMGDKFVEAAEKLEPPGMIGPFTLQAIVTPELEFVVFDVAPRIGGGNNVYMGLGSQYSKLYFGEPISLGRRVAMEIREAFERKELDKVVT